MALTVADLKKMLENFSDDTLVATRHMVTDDFDSWSKFQVLETVKMQSLMFAVHDDVDFELQGKTVLVLS